MMTDWLRPILDFLTGLVKQPTEDDLPPMSITKHFTLAEFTRSDTADRLGLDNTPEPRHEANLGILANKLEQVRALLSDVPIIISSGYRSVKVNKAVGGVQNSDHAQGLAADFNVQGLSAKEACQRIANSDIKFDQLIWEQGENGDWVHFGVGLRMRREVLSWRSGKGYVTGLVKL